MFQFNKEGYLRPYKAVESSLGQVEEAFTWNSHRKGLFEKYRLFNEELQSLQPGSYFQFVDGSFVSKKELPGDLDFVTFVLWERAKLLESKLLHLKRSYSTWLDASFERYYPENHPFHNISVITQDDFHQLYGHTRVNEITGLARPKGYLLLKF